MLRLKVRSALVAGVALLSFATPASAALVVGTFTGGALFPNMATPFAGIHRNFSPFSDAGGTVVYDTAGVTGVGFENVNVGISTADALTFFAGTQLAFDFDDLQSGAIAAVQFNNGQFNGVVYTSDFLVSGIQHTLSVQGGIWTIFQSDNFQTKASGFINIGNANFSTTPYVVPVVPEPATWAMMIAGFGMVGFAMRRRNNVRSTVSYS